MKKFHLLFLLLLSQFSFSFDEFSVGARPGAMGGAFTAIDDDIHSLYYNPAGLSRLGYSQATVSYAQLLPGLSDQSHSGLTFLAYGQLIKKTKPAYGTLAVGLNEFRLQDLFTEREIMVGYGRSFLYDRTLSAGATLKSLQQSFGQDADTQNSFQGKSPGTGRTGVSDPVFSGGTSAQALGLDLGVLYTPFPEINVGLNLRNVNQPDLGLSKKDPVPLVVRLGGSYQKRFIKATLDFTRREFLDKIPDHRLLAGVERTWAFNRSGGKTRSPLTGGYRVSQEADLGKVSIRGGAGLGNRGFRQIDLGLGYEINGFLIDYVFHIPLGVNTVLGNTHNLSLSYKFGPSPDDQELKNLIRREEEATLRAEEALRQLKDEALVIEQNRERLLAEMTDLQQQLEVAKLVATLTPTEKDTSTAPAPSTEAAASISAAAKKALEEFTNAYQSAMGVYGHNVQRGAKMTTRIRQITEIIDNYMPKGVDVSQAEVERKKVKSQLAEKEASYRASLDYYYENAQSLDDWERISLLEKMIKKYKRLGIDTSEAEKELDSLKKTRPLVPGTVRG
jgi:hypothetical protein